MFNCNVYTYDTKMKREERHVLNPHPQGESTKNSFTDLAPGIHRQRLVVEGYPSAPITAEQIKDYLTDRKSVV